MADNSSPDYKSLFLQAEERQKQAEERQKQEEERRKLAEERRKLAEDEGKQEKERRERIEERTRQTTFIEFLRHCHNLLSLPLRVETLSRSTTGTIPLPSEKYCPLRLEPWLDYADQQREIYASVCNYLQPAEEA